MDTLILTNAAKFKMFVGFRRNQCSIRTVSYYIYNNSCVALPAAIWAMTCTRPDQLGRFFAVTSNFSQSFGLR